MKTAFYVIRSALYNLGIKQKNIFGCLRGPERYAFYMYLVATQYSSDGWYTSGIFQQTKNETEGTHTYALSFFFYTVD